MKPFLAFAAAAVLAYASPTGLLEARQAPASCAAGVYIICCRGTFESQEIGGFGLQGQLVKSILAAIPNSNASSVVYPASVVNYGNSVGVGAINAQQQITDYYNECPTSRIVLLGYSQGAQVIGNAITGGSSGIPVLGGISDPDAALSQTIGANVIAINLLGDPNRVWGQGTDYDPQSCVTSSSTPRNGTAYTSMQFYADRLSEWCHQGDPVCCSNGSDPGSHVGYLLSQDNINDMTAYIVEKYQDSL